ncbi:cytochrome b [Neotabrizicola shimadae]|uniref:Cytochrome b/b6 domain-containing protein n=1 Tax=Neotabrizicola shimadae TaxID=2807096 RepID=A0A8G0ZWV9_9RHOB|nr:cytochrome b/b6 domain-containing protein [Neotabrizicola shimadae]QYZ70193.1 cytochrome b/b6 domain-containing protein [Neotabrizicola shimadae]
MAEKSGYSGLQIGLHWLIAGLILFNWFTGEGVGRVLRQLRGGATDVETPLHVWVGVAVLVLVLLRVVVRLLQGGPQPPGRLGSAAVLLAKGGHLLLYVLMIGVPLGGALVWYLGITSLGDMHELAGNVLFFVALAHAAIALFHQYVLKDRLLLRMMRPE